MALSPKIIKQLIETANKIIGTNNSEELVGLVDRSNHIIALNGDDKIAGGSKSDFIEAGAGDDRASGFQGDDVIELGAGNDFAVGGIGADLIKGGKGDDNLQGGSLDKAKDVLHGEEGNDVLLAGFMTKENEYLAGQGSASIFGGTGNDQIFGSNVQDDIDGGADNDIIAGHGGDDRIFGGLGSDSFIYDITKDEGNDIIRDTVKVFRDVDQDKILIRVENSQQSIDVFRNISVASRSIASKIAVSNFHNEQITYKVHLNNTFKNTIQFTHGEVQEIVTFNKDNDILQKFVLDADTGRVYQEINPKTRKIIATVADQPSNPLLLSQS